MSLLVDLETRCDNKCELCGSHTTLEAYLVPPKVENIVVNQVAICDKCESQIRNPDLIDSNHWRCLNDSIWTPVPAVQVLSYLILQQLNEDGWAQDLLSMIYLDDETLEWAQALEAEKANAIVHRDSNGNILQNGDTVVLIKDLDVKGTNFVAKRGTAVRRISLVTDHPEQIQGRINDQTIIILTKYVKK